MFPCNSDKTPIIVAWEQNANASPFAVGVKWKAHPEALPAIPVGAQGLVVFDADRKPGGADGVAAFGSLCASHAVDLSGAFTVETPSGGRHIYFRTDTPYSNSRGSLPDGIDVRGVGGYVIAPGAALPDGRSYRLIQGSWDAIQPLPEALASSLREKSSPATQIEQDAPLATDRERDYASQALADEVAKLSVLRKGSGRNHALNIAAHSLGTMAGWIDQNTVVVQLLGVMRVNGWITDHSEREAVATIESGWNAGRLKPRQPLDCDVEPSILSVVRQSVAMWMDAYRRKHSAKPKRRINLVRMDSIQKEAITWLWEGFIARGTLTMLGGAIQAGKSTIAMSLAATVTTAGLWPDRTQCSERSQVIFWSSEEVIKSVVKPRLMVAGADLSRVHFIESSVDEHGDVCSFDPSQDVPLLRDAINQLGGVALIIIDPMISAVVGDTNKANDVRRSLQPIVDFAEEFNCTILGIHHIAKNSEGKATNDRMLGSQAFTAMARTVLIAVKDSESDERVLAISKSNISKDNGAVKYTIEGVTFPSAKGLIKTSRVIWGEAVEGSSRSILAVAEGEPDSDTSKLGQAKQFLLESLKHQAVGSREILRTAREGYGISEKTLRRAQQALGIKPQHDLAFEGGWSWSLPISGVVPR